MKTASPILTFFAGRSAFSLFSLPLLSFPTTTRFHRSPTLPEPRTFLPWLFSDL